jgi:hypothetical protein
VFGCGINEGLFFYFDDLGLLHNYIYGTPCKALQVFDQNSIKINYKPNDDFKSHITFRGFLFFVFLFCLRQIREKGNEIFRVTYNVTQMPLYSIGRIKFGLSAGGVALRNC